MNATHQETLTIDGMHCEHCVDVVRNVLDNVGGVSVQDVEIGEARVAYESGRVSEDKLASAVEDAGYELIS